MEYDWLDDFGGRRKWTECWVELMISSCVESRGFAIALREMYNLAASGRFTMFIRVCLIYLSAVLLGVSELETDRRCCEQSILSHFWWSSFLNKLY